MDEPVPVRRAAVGCLLVAVTVVAIGLLIRPAIFTLAPPRDDSALIVATAQEVSGGPIVREVLLSRSYGWDGEREAGDGRVQLSLVIAPTTPGGISAVNAASPVEEDCPIEVDGDRLRDCEGRAWTFAGLPFDDSHPPLQRFPARVEDGSVVVDLTQTESAA